eukprot:1194561-Prorocentrum_minimum.AAC.3
MPPHAPKRRWAERGSSRGAHGGEAGGVQHAPHGGLQSWGSNQTNEGRKQTVSIVCKRNKGLV